MEKTMKIEGMMCGHCEARVKKVLEKLEEYRAEARQAAMRNAQMRASQLAEAVGQTIGACYEINDYTTNVEVSTRGRLLMKNAVMMDAAVTEEAEPEVDFEQIVINYNISAKFYLNTEKQ